MYHGGGGNWSELVSEAVVVVDWSSSCMMKGMVVGEVDIRGQVGVAGAGAGRGGMQANVVEFGCTGRERRSIWICLIAVSSSLVA